MLADGVFGEDGLRNKPQVTLERLRGRVVSLTFRTQLGKDSEILFFCKGTRAGSLR